MRTKEELPACPVATTVSLIGSKWKLLIMRNLLMRPWWFNELRKSLDGISQKVLTDSLRSMEEDGLVVRTVYAEVPPRVEYALSPLGEWPQGAGYGYPAYSVYAAQSGDLGCVLTAWLYGAPWQRH